VAVKRASPDCFTSDVAFDALSALLAAFTRPVADELEDNEPPAEALLAVEEVDALAWEDASFLEETDCENAVPVNNNAAAIKSLVFIMSV
jgi:hypothetical protein